MTYCRSSGGHGATEGDAVTHHPDQKVAGPYGFAALEVVAGPAFVVSNVDEASVDGGLIFTVQVTISGCLGSVAVHGMLLAPSTPY